MHQRVSDPIRAVRRRRSRPAVLAALVGLLIPGLLVVAGPATAADESAGPAAITQGTLVWGVKESFRNYIGADEMAAEDGARVNGDGLFEFDVLGGSYDPVSEVTDIRFGGTAHLTGYGGILNITFSNPRVLIDPTGSFLYADTVDSDGSSSATSRSRAWTTSPARSTSTPTAGSRRGRASQRR